MKQRLVIWGKGPEEERVLLALDLHPNAKAVDVFSFPEQVATEELNNLLMNQWRNEKPVEFPDEHQKFQTELSLSESILPEGYSVDKEDILKRAQTEWNFVAMSTKMSRVYHEELEELSKKVDALDEFDHDLWEELKAYWDKVQTQIRDKNLIRDHADSLRKKTNEVFADMKVLRRKMDEKFREESEKNMEKYMKILDEIEEKIEKGLGLKPIFEELKEIQRDFNDERFTRQHRSRVWKRLDGAFKTVKKKRFGEKKGKGKSKLQHLQRRYDGLIKAIEKMESSIRRDQNDRNYQDNRIEGAGGQLESQIRQAKIKMIEERIRSKKNKLDDMLDTKEMLEDRIEKAKKKKKEKEAKHSDQSEQQKASSDQDSTGEEESESSAGEQATDTETSSGKDAEEKTSPEDKAGSKGEGSTQEQFEELKNKTEAMRKGDNPSSEEE